MRMSNTKRCKKIRLWLQIEDLEIFPAVKTIFC